MKTIRSKTVFPLVALLAACSSAPTMPSGEGTVESAFHVCSGVEPPSIECYQTVCASGDVWQYAQYPAGTACRLAGTCDESARCIVPALDFNAPWISSTRIVTSTNSPIALVNGQYPLTIGERYTIIVHIEPGDGFYTAGVELNPAFGTPASANVHNARGSTIARIPEARDQLFTVSPSEPGEFEIGFLMRDAGSPIGTSHAFNAVRPVRVVARSPWAGLYGTVTSRATGAGLGGATVLVGNQIVTTAADGTWRLPSAGSPGSALTVTVRKAGYSEAVAVNVKVPAASGVSVNAALEEPFVDLAAAGMKYTTFIDFSRGRTVLHVVSADPARSNVTLARSGDNPSVVAVARSTDALVAINGAYFNTKVRDLSTGYFYALGYTPSEVLPEGTIEAESATLPRPVLQPAGILPMLAISGRGGSQWIRIVDTAANFNVPSDDWQTVNHAPIWDRAPRDGASDVDFAAQCSPRLLKQGAVIHAVGDPSLSWARTAVGIGGGKLYLVVADGERVNGAQGASLDQLGRFFRDVLTASDAMNFDGGGSTEMVLRGAGGLRVVNALTSEDSSWSGTPDGRVLSFLTMRAAPR